MRGWARRESAPFAVSGTQNQLEHLVAELALESESADPKCDFAVTSTRAGTVDR